MNIKKLFSELDNDDILQSVLTGKFALKGNCIIWSYNLFEDDKEIDTENYKDEEDDDELNFGFDIRSNEEILFDTCHEDMLEIKEFINGLDDFDDVSYSEPEIIGNTISFKIF